MSNQEESTTETLCDWEYLREMAEEPMGTDEFARIDLPNLPEDIRIWIMDNDFPETTVWREGDVTVCEIREHIYTKFWQHKFSAYTFAEAMERAVIRLTNEGHPFRNPSRDDEDVHIHIGWQLLMPRDADPSSVVEAIKTGFNCVWHRAGEILENSDSVLILGKDTGPGLLRLQAIAEQLEKLGYFTYIIKDQPDKLGEGVIQKVLRYALSSKFVLIENTESSGHLYEIPHVVKSAECVSVVLQETGRGATWMFEDAYQKHNHWHKIEYDEPDFREAVIRAAAWAEDYVQKFANHQERALPWLKKP